MADGDDDLELEDDALPEPEPEPEADPEPEPEADPEPEPEAALEPGEDRTPQPQERRSRSEDRIRTLTDSNRELIRQNAELNRRFDEFTRQRSQPQGESPEQRAQRLALLTPEERLTEQLNYAQRQHQQDIQQLSMQIEERGDRAAFEAKCTPGTIHAKWKDRVDQELTRLRGQGANAPREAVLKYLLGDAMLAKQGSGENRQQRRQAENRVRRQTTRPAPNGSDVRAERGRTTSLERRLENVNI